MFVSLDAVMEFVYSSLPNPSVNIIPFSLLVVDGDDARDGGTFMNNDEIAVVAAAALVVSVAICEMNFRLSSWGILLAGSLLLFLFVDQA